MLPIPIPSGIVFPNRKCPASGGLKLQGLHYHSMASAPAPTRASATARAARAGINGLVLPHQNFPRHDWRGGWPDGVDESFVNRTMDGFGAFILGHNMFGPLCNDCGRRLAGLVVRQSPYRAPTFVLTHHPRKSIIVEAAPFPICHRRHSGGS